MERRKNAVCMVFVMTVMLFSLTACSGKTDNVSSKEPEKTVETEVSEQENTSDSAEKNEAEEKTDVSDTDGTGAVQNDTNSTKVLVAYFSATGNTKKLAKYAAEVTGADLYEIVPKKPYTDADLNYGNDNSRTSVEQNDSASRPEIDGSVANMGQYSIIFIGYPIWWGQAPRIISTFLESYDFSGKTIIPFCTSGSSAIGSSATNLQTLVSDSAVWKEGKRFGSQATKDEIAAWINSQN